MDRPAAVVAGDGEEFVHHAGGQDWIMSWHPPQLPPPSGTPHGSEAVCVTVDGHVVLVSENSTSWVLPGGRPEAGEDWRATLDREVLEEACARVEEAELLGFGRGRCTRGPEEGLVLVRSLWRAAVSLEPWNPRHEIRHRLLVPPSVALSRITPQSPRPIYRRLFREALGAQVVESAQRPSCHTGRGGSDA